MNGVSQVMKGEFQVNLLCFQQMREYVPPQIVPCLVGGEVFLYQLSGSCDVFREEAAERPIHLEAGDVTLVSLRTDPRTAILMCGPDGGTTMCVTNSTIPPL
jgi:hypothetical protein